MERTREVMHERERAILWGEVPSRDTHGVGGGEQSAEQDEEACVFSGRHHAVTVQERRTP